MVGSGDSRCTALRRYVSASVQLVLLVVCPAQAVEIRGIVRIFGQRALHQIHRFVQTHAAIGQHVAVIVQHRRIARIDRQHALESLFGLIVFLLPLVNAAQQEADRFPVRGPRRQFFRDRADCSASLNRWSLK